MTVDQFYTALEKKGITKDQFIRRVSLLFFLGDLADTLSLEIENMMQPHGGLDYNIKNSVKMVSRYAKVLIKHSDKSLSDENQLDFATSGDRFKSLAYGWAGLDEKSKPFVFEDLYDVINRKSNGNKLKVLTYAQVFDLVKDAEFEMKPSNN